MANVVRRVVIEGLYDNYNYDITFHKDGVTLITAPNGFGKTTVLNIIKNALDLKFMYFYNLLFKKIEIFFVDKWEDTRLVITRIPNKEKTFFDDESEKYNVKFCFYSNGGKRPKDTYTLKGKSFDERSEFFYYLMMTEKNKNSGEKSLKDKVNDQTDSIIRQNFKNYSIFLNDKKCLFIKEQRILSGNNSSEDNPEKYTITQLAEDLKSRYAKQKSRYTDESQRIDSSFVKRLLGRNNKTYEATEYQEKINGLEKIVESYKKFGLISNYSFFGQFDKDFKPALSLYINDMFEKIDVYERFYQQLSLFNQFVNGKGLSNKKMVLNEHDGISFRSDSGRIVPIHKLSSGEQNLVILFYRLVFETEPNTLLLIDEPENSLHVEWLQKMLSDYLVMESNLGCQMIIATHSPTFINGNWDIAYDLDGGSYQNM